jgi:hypothetical protein
MTPRLALVLAAGLALAVLPPPAAAARPTLVAARSASPNHVELEFSRPFSRSLLRRLDSYRIPGLFVFDAIPSRDRRRVTLRTGPQEAREYVALVRRRGAFRRLRRDRLPFAGVLPVTAPEPDVVRPTVVGALALDPRTVRVVFSEAMGDDAFQAGSYRIAAETAVAGGLSVLAVDPPGPDRAVVTLHTTTQSEIDYRVNAAGVRDLAGNPVKAATTAAGVTFDPASAAFQGIAATAGEIVDSDGDGLIDEDEQRGWTIRTVGAGGLVDERLVTSDPRAGNADTDLDGLGDGVEKAIGTDPRRADSDADELSDFVEFNEVFSDPTRQDTDGDGLHDGLEFAFFLTSPNFADTDGDQLPDGDEILAGARSPRLADVPTPRIAIEGGSLALDVRFTATSARGTRTLQSKSVETTLEQSDSRTATRVSGDNHKASVKDTFSQTSELEVSPLGIGATVGTKGTDEASYAHTYTFTQSSESVRASQRTWAESRKFESERTEDETVKRVVSGARMSAAVTLGGEAGSVAFTVSDLQLTASIPDAADPSLLVPVATLVPPAGAPTSFDVGPLVGTHGPLVFESRQVFPSVVERLMASPTALVFRIADYRVRDERGRSFGFTSQEINDRTAGVVIDYGVHDADGDGIGDGAERYRVATASGRPAADTNGDGVIDAGDRRMVFLPDGRPAGITLADALQAIGLARYDERVTPSSTITPAQRRNSYAVKPVRFDVDGDGVVEPTEPELLSLWRVRDVSRDDSPLRAWLVITNALEEGVFATPFDVHTLLPGTQITLAFLEDQDDDGVVSTLEALRGCSDKRKDTDGDGLSDLRETFRGWSVEVAGRGARVARASCANPDTDGDGLPDAVEATRTLARVSDARDVPAALDASTPDTDDDGLTDAEEVQGVRFPLVDADGDLAPDGPLAVTMDPGDVALGRPFQACSLDERTAAVHCTACDLPRDPFCDGDLLTDGEERELGTNPVVEDAAGSLDRDADGLRDLEEQRGWTVTMKRPGLAGPRIVVEEVPRTCTPPDFGDCADLLPGFEPSGDPPQPPSDPSNPDTDGDGLGDDEEKALGLHPRLRDTDGDGLSDREEVEDDLTAGCRDPSKRLDPHDPDTDDDGRLDGDEVRGAIVVPVAAPERVFTCPTEADEDLDGLVDGARRIPATLNGQAITLLDGEMISERVVRPVGAPERVETQPGPTNPKKADSDGDGTDDRTEIRRPTPTNPVRPDKVVRFGVTSIKVPHDKDCDPGTDGSNGFSGRIGIRVNGESRQLLDLITGRCFNSGKICRARSACEDAVPTRLLDCTSRGLCLAFGGACPLPSPLDPCLGPQACQQDAECGSRSCVILVPGDPDADPPILPQGRCRVAIRFQPACEADVDCANVNGANLGRCLPQGSPSPAGLDAADASCVDASGLPGACEGSFLPCDGDGDCDEDRRCLRCVTALGRVREGASASFTAGLEVPVDETTVAEAYSDDLCEEDDDHNGVCGSDDERIEDVGGDQAMFLWPFEPEGRTFEVDRRGSSECGLEITFQARPR